MKVSRAHQVSAAILAAIAWYGLGLRFSLSMTQLLNNGYSVAGAVVRFFSFFTILTNTLVAIVLTVPLLWPRSRAGRWLSTASVRCATGSYIALVGLVYSLALRQLWDPQGRELLADRLLHDVVPALYVIYWTLFAEKGVVRWRDIPGWLAYPMLYLAVTLVHGAFIGWYPYPFINVTKLGYGRTFVNVLILITTFAVIGAVIQLIDRLFARIATPAIVRSNDPPA